MDNEIHILSGCCTDLSERLDPELFRALCDPVRLALLARLATATMPLTVSELSDCCGIHLSGVSRHLAILRTSGVITAQKQGREVRYLLERAHLVGTLRALADAVENCKPGDLS